jgi:mRNA-degrading endonuclease RelE of RelBE toxin-antitoxin system
MPSNYRVIVLRSFEREVRRLRQRVPRSYENFLEAVKLLECDPYNLQHHADIKKLTNIAAGEGQFRLRIGDYRLRYDIHGDDVILHSMRPRSKSYD